MLTKHYLAKAYMNKQNESLLADLVAIPFRIGYMCFWDFWHTDGVTSSIDTGKIGLQNYFYYKKWEMTAEDRKKQIKSH